MDCFGPPAPLRMRTSSRCIRTRSGRPPLEAEPLAPTSIAVASQCLLAALGGFVSGYRESPLDFLDSAQSAVDSVACDECLGECPESTPEWVNNSIEAMGPKARDRVCSGGVVAVLGF